MNTPDSRHYLLPCTLLVLAALAGFILSQSSGLAAAAAAPAVAAAPTVTPAAGAPALPPPRVFPAVPAPVPSAVAIPRPTEQEVAQANDTLKKLLANAD